MKTVLALVDFSDGMAPVVRTAGEMAKAFSAKLLVLHASQPEAYVTTTEIGPVISRDDLAEGLRTEHRKLVDLEQQLKGDGVDATCILAHGPPVEKALEHARRVEASMIVVGSHGHGALYHLLLGNVATGVLKKATCPVVVVPCRKA